MLNQRGRTLLELMIAAALIVFAMLAFATMITSQRTASIHAQQMAEASSAGMRVQKFMASPDQCMQNLLNRNPNQVQQVNVLQNTLLEDIFWTPAHAPAQVFGNLVSLASMELQPGPVVIGPDSSGVIYLQSRFIGITPNALSLRPRTIPIYVETNTIGLITNCTTKTTNPYSCRVVTVGGNNNFYSAVCDQPFEQLIGCGVEDNNIAESNPNYLIPVTGSSSAMPAVPFNLPPSHDAQVDASFPNTNYGGGVYLNAAAGPPIRETLLRFDIPSVPGTVLSVVLRLFVTNGSADGPRVYQAGSGWTEGTVTYATKPPLGALVTDLGAVPNGAYVDIPVSIPGPGTYSFLIQGTADAIQFESKEFDNNVPHLLAMIIPTSTGTSGRCECFDEEDSSLQCHAICCRL